MKRQIVHHNGLVIEVCPSELEPHLNGQFLLGSAELGTYIEHGDRIEVLAPDSVAGFDDDVTTIHGHDTPHRAQEAVKRLFLILEGQARARARLHAIPVPPCPGCFEVHP